MPEREIIERSVLRAMFRSAHVSDEDIRWRRYRFDEEQLRRHLGALGEVPQDLVHFIATRLGMSVLRMDPLTLDVRGFERRFDRQSIAEGMGAMGVQFFPTRQSAMRSAYESAREVAYFGYGDFDAQCFACPVARLVSALTHDDTLPELGTIFRDIRAPFMANRAIFDILSRDRYFPFDMHDAETLIDFQKYFRQHPMSPEFVEKCSEFFNRRATIGVRDSIRWLLGSRHPWFDWQRARELIQSAFDLHGQTDFNTPQIVYYAYDPELDEVDIHAMQAHNARVESAFALMLEDALRAESPDIISHLAGRFVELARWILDIHHDYPDFDLESQGSLGPSTHFEFLGHSLQNTLNRELLGEETRLRRNYNMRAHFEALELTHTFLDGLSDASRERFFAVLAVLLERYDREGGVPCDDGIQLYTRIPCTLFLLQDLGIPQPRQGERLLDTFDLSQMTQLEHASYMRTFPEISEKLVVFFTLTLRHMLDTEHVPDLRPRNFTRDFLLLGLWGTRTPNLVVNLYVDQALDEKDLASNLSRCEIRFTGTEQVETHPLEHIREEAKTLRMAVMHFAPLIEPSILRNLGTFTMAMEEFRSATHAFELDPFSLMHYAVDMVHEMARCGVRRSLTDILAVLEYVIDNTHHGVEHKLNQTLSRLQKHDAHKKHNPS